MRCWVVTEWIVLQNIELKTEIQRADKNVLKHLVAILNLHAENTS